MASTKAQQEELAKLFAKYHSKLSYLYTSYTKRIIKTIPIGEKAEDYWIDNPLFNFDLFPELRERLNQIFIEYFNDNMLCYKQGISDGVALAYSQDDVNLGKYTILQDRAIDTARKAAQTAFYERRVQRQGGLSLSDRVWNYAQMGKSEIETAIANVIGDGITKGTSAEELGRAVRQYLNNPDMMYRRYHKLIVDNAGHKRRVVRWYRRHIDENGNVTFKDEPLEKVGTGTYRSARMNSLRLMRTEINMAYHNANNERWQREPFVIGIRIWLSPEHPEYDICDELMGEYPKNFVFTSWHANCLCASAPITIQGDEKKEFYRRLMDGEDMSNYMSPNAVKTPPAAWNKYIKDQHDNILAAGERGKLAYHLRDNTKYWLGQFSADEQKRMGFEGKIPQKKLTVDEIKDRFSSIRDKYREIERNYGVPSRAFLNERDKMFEALRGTDIDVMQKQLSIMERKLSAYERWNDRFIERYVNPANELLKKLEDYPVAGRKTLSEALAKRDRDLIIGAFKMAEAKYRYEVSITPDNLRYSKWIETFFGGDKSTALSVHNAIIRAEKAAYAEKTAEEAVIKFSESLLDINIKYSGNKNIIKAIDLYSQREAKRIKDKYLFDELSENIVTNTRYLINNATKVFSKNIPIKQIDWDAMWYGDIDTLSGVNKSIMASRSNLDTLLEAQKVLEVSQSQTLKSLYDSLIYNYERYGLDYDGGNKLMNQMKDKLAQLSSLSDKKLHDYIFKQRGFLSPDDVRSISDIEAGLSRSVEKVKYRYAKSYYDKVIGIVDDEIMFSKRDFIPQSLLKLKQKIDDAIDYGVSKNILDRYLNDYIHKASVLISYDEQVYAGMRTSLGNIIQRAKNDNIAARTVKNMLKVDEENIIKRLCGADKTEGSCSSLAFSYAGQKGGLDVIDFRDGESRLFFARNTNIGEIVKLRGGYVIDNIEDDYKATKKLLKVMREGHEYYLGVGKHSSVVRKINGELQYLELQSSIQNGWKPFGNIDWKLKDRFGCQHSHSIGNYHFSIINCIIDIDRLILDKNYRKLMEFINTDTLKQNKGIGGGIR